MRASIPMKPGTMSLSLTVALAILLLGSRPKAFGDGMTGKTSIPRIARIGGIEIGRSSQEDLARIWGEGKTIIGGHPNSGRLWRVPGTSWILRTDGFDYSSRGLVVDGLTLYGDSQSFYCPELLIGVPNTRLSRKAFAWAGEVSPGMSRQQVLEFLKKRSLPIQFAPDGCETTASGLSLLTNTRERLEKWKVSFVLTNGTLSLLNLSAEFKPRK